MSVDPCCLISRGKRHYGDSKGTKNAMSVDLCCRINCGRINRVQIILTEFASFCGMPLIFLYCIVIHFSLFLNNSLIVFFSDLITHINDRVVDMGSTVV